MPCLGPGGRPPRGRVRRRRGPRRRGSPRGRTDDRHAVVLEGLGQAQRGLAAELDDHTGDRAGQRLRVDDLQHVLERQRLEVQTVGGVVVRGDGLGVAVDHHGLVARVAEREGGVDAGVVELDALADAVRTGTQDDHRGLLARRDLRLLVVRGVEVRRLRRELGGAGVDRLVHRAHTQRVPHLAHHVLAQPADLGDLGVGEAVPLGLGEQLGVELVGGAQLVRDLLDQEELVDEPRVDLRRLEDLLGRGARADGLHDGVDPAVGGPHGLFQEKSLVTGLADERELAALLLQRPQRLLQRLGEVAADRHGLADRLHGGRQGGVGGGNFSKAKRGAFTTT